LLVVGIAAAAIAVTSSASAEPAPSPAVEVEIQAGGVSGLRPDGSTVYFQVRVLAQGADATSLAGEGRHIGSAGNQNYWSATGSVAGNVVTLGGVIAESPNPLLVGVPVVVSGDSSTRAITLTMGPLPQGPPYNGATIVAHGSGRVVIGTASG
jgi:hypothetical protein